MKIACLAFGSLLWKPGTLRLASVWMPDGPKLPLEFARVGDHGELAVVLLDGARTCPTWWALLDSRDADEAREALRVREEISPARPEWVGSSPGDPRTPFSGAIREWRMRRGFDLVVWTALPPRIEGVEGRAPTSEEAVDYLASLGGETLDHAREYIRRVPSAVATPTRELVVERLGWTPIDAAQPGAAV